VYPYLIRIGGLSVPSYPLLYGAGIAAAGAVAIHLGKRDGLNRRKIAHLVLLMGLLILIGGRAFYVCQHLSDFKGRAGDALDLSQGGQVFYGGMILALVGLVLFAKATRMRVWPALDAVSVGATLGLVFGRLGCFCRGCCYGRVTDSFLGVQFPPHVDIHGKLVGSPVFARHVQQCLIEPSALASLPVHPSQLYSAGVSILLFLVMLFLWRKRLLEGRLLFAYLLLYCFARFFLEFTRDNEMAFWGLTIPQVVSVAILALSILALLALRRAGHGAAGKPNSRPSMLRK